MSQLIPIIVLLPVIAFWLWMFWDMTGNDRLPDISTPLLTWPPSSKFGWTLAFILLNVFSAIFYYFWEYRNRR